MYFNIINSFLILDIDNYFDVIEEQLKFEIIIDENSSPEEIEEADFYTKYEEWEKKKENGELDDNEGYQTSNDFFISTRKNRDLIKHSFIIRKFLVGDVLEFVYFFKNAVLIFNGICIAIKKKSFILPDLSLILRNVIIKTGTELIFSYFYNRAYNQKFLDFKRKIYTFNKNKFYFIRDRVNKESRVS